MNASNRFLLCVPVLLALGSPATAADGDAALDAVLAELRDATRLRVAWENPLMPEATGAERAISADAILLARVSEYTRALFDRGGWVNSYVVTPGYDAGNALLAVQPSEGVSSRGAWPLAALTR